MRHSWQYPDDRSARCLRPNFSLYLTWPSLPYPAPPRLFWTPAILFAFSSLPMRQQSVFFSGVGLAWNVLLSLLSNPRSDPCTAVRGSGAEGGGEQRGAADSSVAERSAGGAIRVTGMCVTATGAPPQRRGGASQRGGGRIGFVRSRSSLWWAQLPAALVLAAAGGRVQAEARARARAEAARAAEEARVAAAEAEAAEAAEEEEAARSCGRAVASEVVSELVLAAEATVALKEALKASPCAMSPSVGEETTEPQQQVYSRSLGHLRSLKPGSEVSPCSTMDVLPRL